MSAGKGDRIRSFDREKWDEGWKQAFKKALKSDAMCKHNFQFDHHYRALSGKTASAFRCAKCERWLLKPGDKDNGR